MSKEQNIVIAVYCGAKYIFDGDTLLFPRAPADGRVNNPVFADELKYHESYNDLLPVVNKVMDELGTIDGGTSRDLQNGIHWLLRTCYKDITPVYVEIVSAIKYINQIAAINQ